MSQHQRALNPAIASEAIEPAGAPARAPISLAEVKATSPAEAPAEDSWLDLPLPDGLPAEMQLSENEKRRMHGVLCGLLDALQLEHPANVERLDLLLADLGTAFGERPDVETTGLPLTPFQATDYDRYFRVNRQSSQEPAAAMVRSLVQTARAVTQLFARGKSLPVTAIRHQLQGFESHAHLLARTFSLEPLR